MSNVIEFRRPAAAPLTDDQVRARTAMAADLLLRAEGLALQAAWVVVTLQAAARIHHAANLLADTRRQALEDMTPPPKGAA